MRCSKYKLTNFNYTTYNKINGYYIENKSNSEIEEELNKLSTKNDFDILIKSDNLPIYASQRDLNASIDKLNGMIEFEKNKMSILCMSTALMESFKKSNRLKINSNWP